MLPWWSWSVALGWMMAGGDDGWRGQIAKLPSVHVVARKFLPPSEKFWTLVKQLPFPCPVDISLKLFVRGVGSSPVSSSR